MYLLTNNISLNPIRMREFRNQVNFSCFVKVNEFFDILKNCIDFATKYVVRELNKPFSTIKRV